MKKYVVFGTGSGGKKVYTLIQKHSTLVVECFLDNFPKEDQYMSLPVRKADQFLQETELDQYIFIIASVYKEEIIEQLCSYGVSMDCIWSGLDVVLNNWENYVKKLENIELDLQERAPSIVFDCASGFVLGGVENWTYNLIRKCLEEGYENVVMLSNDTDTEAPEDIVSYAQVIKGVKSFYDYDVESVKKIEEKLAQCLPCVVFTAHIDNFLLAACHLKQTYENEIKIVSVIHGGLQRILKDNVKIADRVDYIMCVSPDAKKSLCEEYHLPEQKVLFKETPVEGDLLKNREYTLDLNQPIQIAYASRLEKIHKHSELLIPLILQLEKEKVNYHLDIAGDGALYHKLNEFIKEYGLEQNVKMLGKVEYGQMKDFWRQHDLAINLSECEGCSLAMLESMVQGTVPVFTDVFSSKHFIQDGYNGFIVKYGNISAMSDKIKYLAENRTNLVQMGIRANSTIVEKCSMDDYFRYLKKIIL